MVNQMLQNSTTCTNFIFDNLYLCSTTYINIQYFLFILNNTNFLSTSTNQKEFHTTTILVQLQPKLFSFNKNICSTSTENNVIQQQYLLAFASGIKCPQTPDYTIKSKESDSIFHLITPIIITEFLSKISIEGVVGFLLKENDDYH